MNYYYVYGELNHLYFRVEIEAESESHAEEIFNEAFEYATLHDTQKADD